MNKNKNTAVEIANKELEKEILRLKLNRGKISETELALVLNNLNNRIRYHGLSSREILFRRSSFNNEEKNINDTKVANKQHANQTKESEYREKYKSKMKKRTQQRKFEIGDLVFLRASKAIGKPLFCYCIEVQFGNLSL